MQEHCKLTCQKLERHYMPGSIPCKGEVPVKAENGLTPEEDERRLVQSLDSVIDQIDSIPESTEQVISGVGYLPLGSLDSRWVLVLFLVVSKEQLTRCGIVRILTGQYCLDAKLE